MMIKIANRAQREAEAGNVFIMILIAVILFAALMFTFTRSARQGGENISQKQAELNASDIIDYTQSLEQSVNELLLKGCSENQISFDTGLFNGFYANANSPADGSCNVFKSNGGHLTWQSPPPGTNDGVGKRVGDGSNVTATYFFDSRRNIQGIGTGAYDLIVDLEVSQNICTALNEKLHNSSYIPTESWNYWQGNDFFNPQPGITEGCSSNGAYGSVDVTSVCANQVSYCRHEQSTNAYYFYHVLMAR